jgi:hypothetical protein
MWDIPKLYISACYNSVQLVPLQPIVISILFHHYKESMKHRNEVGEIMMIETKVNSNNSIVMEIEKLQETQEEIEEEIPTTLDGFFTKNDANYGDFNPEFTLFFDYVLHILHL